VVPQVRAGLCQSASAPAPKRGDTWNLDEVFLTIHGERHYLRRALEVARQQRAKSWELRAAMSLARLWRQRDSRREAYDLIAPPYRWFTEGFDAADLQKAEGPLGELR
jgi:hypothetical protein